MMTRLVLIACLVPVACVSTPPPPGVDVTDIPLSAHMELHVPDSEQSCRAWGNIYVHLGVLTSRSFCGRTTNGEPDPSSAAEPSNALPFAVLLVEGRVDGRLMLFHVTSDANGHFCAPSIPAGTYRVRACSGPDNGAGFNLTAFDLVISADAPSAPLRVPITLGV